MFYSRFQIEHTQVSKIGKNSVDPYSTTNKFSLIDFFRIKIHAAYFVGISNNFLAGMKTFLAKSVESWEHRAVFSVLIRSKFHSVYVIREREGRVGGPSMAGHSVGTLHSARTSIPAWG